MAFPTIIIDSATGSDTGTSGAGPGDGTTTGAAVTGTAAAHTGGVASTTITLTNSPDLSAVLTDGTHAIRLVTASGRQWSKITAVDNTAKTVTVVDSFNIASGSAVDYAIGGKRASWTNSSKLWDSATTGAKPGWVIEFATAHAENITATQNIYLLGDQTSGFITVRGKLSGTRPMLTVTNNGIAWLFRNRYCVVEHIELRNNNATKTASYGLYFDAQPHIIRDVKIADSTNNFWRPIYFGSGGTIAGRTILHSSVIGYAADAGINVMSAVSISVHGCRIYNCTGDGISHAGSRYGSIIQDNVIYGNGGNGCNIAYNFNNFPECEVNGNVFDNNTLNGILFGDARCIGRVTNNVISRCGASYYGINAPAGSAAAAQFADYNAFWSNTNNLNNLNAGANDVILSADPYTDKATGDYSLNSTVGGGADCVDAGFPQSIPG